MDKKRTTLGTIGRQAAQGLTFNFADELADPLAALMAKAILGNKADLGELYSQARANSQNELARDWQEAPVTSFAANVAGGVPFGFTKAAGSVANWARNAGRLGRIGRGAAAGAGYGAVAGAGAGGDSLESRAGSAATGALLGAALGGTGGAFSKPADTGQLATQKSVKQAKKLATSRAEKSLMEDLAQRPDLPEVLKRAETLSQQSQRTGIPLTLAEMVAQSNTDPLLAQQALLKTNPMTAGRVDQFYTARLGTPQQQGSIEAALLREAQKTGGAGSYDEVAQALINRAKQATGEITGKLVAQSEPLYTEAFKKRVNPNQLKSVLTKDPVAASYLRQAMGNADPSILKQVQKQPINSVAAIDAAKKLMDKALQGYGADAPANPRAINEARDALVALADQYAPAYQQARQVYSGQPDVLAMRSRIGALADVDPSKAQDVAKNLFSGTQQNAQMAAQALGQDAQKAVGARIYNAMDTLRNPLDPSSGQVTQLANRIAPDARTLEMLKTYGAPQSLDDALAVINQAKISDRLVYGSPTQPLSQAAQGMQDAASMGIDALSGNKFGIMRKVANMLGRGDVAQDPQFMKDMADLMMTDRGMDLLRRAALGQQNALQEISQAPSLLRIGADSATSSRALASPLVGGVSAMNTPQQSPVVVPTEDFGDIEQFLNTQPAQPANDFQDIEQFLNSQPQSNAGDLFERIKMKESGGDPNAQAKTSSASGLYQFTDNTWRDIVGKYGAQYGITEDMKNDPQAQEIMVRHLAQDNAAILANAGIEPSDQNIYFAHFMGAPAAAKALSSNPETVAAQVFPAAARANQTIFFRKDGTPRTIGEVYQVVTKGV